MVGCQTKLKHGEQTRIFRTIPALENARFARLGGIHRNTFLNSPRLLDGEFLAGSEIDIDWDGTAFSMEAAAAGELIRTV